jgi:Family of unknown function (DUF5908)
MPVEIRELVITAVISNGRSAGSSDVAPAGGNNAPAGGNNAANTMFEEPDALVEACVKQVLKILKRKQER